MPELTLKRSVTLPFLIFYGVGTMVGGGFYALLGKVAGEAGMATPFAFALTGLLALLSAFSFAEMSSRYPVSAGEAYYIREGFGSVGVSTVVGWLVIATGVVSAATLSVASIGFLREAFPLNETLGIVLLVLAMAMVAGWGIGQSVGVVTIITAIEVGALFYAFGINVESLEQLPARAPEMLPSLGSEGTVGWLGVFAGAFLAFYAFIGFEDMVNLAEEVKKVRRTLPTAIIVSIVLTTLLYVGMSLVAVLSLPLEQLVQSATPVAALARGEGWIPTTGLWPVSILTGLNDALVQLIMASRVAYGMASRDQAPTWLGAVNAHTRTPLRATASLGIATMLLAIFFPLTTLAEITSSIILVIFASVNLALWRIKGSDPDPRGEGPRYPRWLPLAGFLASAAVLLFNAWLVLYS